ncbi:MAG: isochorismatase family protein [Bacteroidetes bacterium]|nr:MAG: isochorismatase family protein [Bacteroidota bacterium]
MKIKILFVTVMVLAMMLPVSLISQDQDRGKSPLKPALLVIDIQNAFMGMVPEGEKEVAMTNISYYIELFRKHGCPIVRIHHQSEEFGVLPGTDAFEFPSSVPIKDDDPRVVKTYSDAFNKTDLDSILKGSGSNTLFLCGLSSVGCVLATWIGAQNHDYNAFILKDAIMSHNSDFTNNVEVMFDAVGYEMVKLVLDNSGE